MTLGDDTRIINKVKQANAISPNHTHSLDAAHLMLTVLHARQAYGITNFALIHDSFGTHAARTDELAVILRETFVELYQGDPLAAFREEVLDQLQHHPKLAGELPTLPNQGHLDLTAIRAARYMFA